MLWSRTSEPYRLSSHAESGSLANSSSLSCIPHTHHVGRGREGERGRGGEGGKRDTIEGKYAKKSNPDVLTRVSEYVPEVVEFVEKIIDNGYA